MPRPLRVSLNEISEHYHSKLLCSVSWLARDDVAINARSVLASKKGTGSHAMTDSLPDLVPEWFCHAGMMRRH